MSVKPSQIVRTPPQSEDAEVSVLGSILIDRDAIVEVAEFLKPNHFYFQKYGKIYEAMLTLYEHREPLDVITVAEQLRKMHALEDVGGSTILSDLVERVPTAANTKHYGHIIKDHYTKRELISMAASVTDLAFDAGAEVAQVMDKAEQAIFTLSQQHLKQVFIPIKDALAESFDRLDELQQQAGGMRGVPTGFKDLDDCLSGMMPSNLLILAARPGVGKTAFSLNVARHITTKYKMSVGIFSLEMSKEELVDRLLVSQADIDAWRLKTGRLDDNDFAKLSDAMGTLADAPLYIDDTPGISIMEMRTKARRLMAEHGLKLIIVDYLQLIKGRGLENRVTEVGEISMGLKNLARELKVPVIALSQLSRAVEHRTGDKSPVLADLRESGSIEQDADVVMFLYRDNDEDLSSVKLNIAKHRNGSLRMIDLRYRGDRLQFFGVEKLRVG